MKREFLKGLGLSDEVIEKIMAENGRDVQAEIDKANVVMTERDTLKQQVADRDKDIADLKKKAGDNSDLQTQLTDLQAKYKLDTENYQKQITEMKLHAALDAEITKAGGKNAKAIKALLPMDKIKLKDDGTLEGLDLKGLKETDAYLFEEEETPMRFGATPAGKPDVKTGMEGWEQQLDAIFED